MIGVSYVVASGQGECAIVILELVGFGKLLEEDRHKSFGMGGRAVTGFKRADRERDMVLEVGTRSILAIPARREHDLDAYPVWTSLLGEFERLRGVSLGIFSEAMEPESVVVGRVPPGLVSGTSDHAKTLRKLYVRLLATMEVVDTPSCCWHELKLAGVPMLVVETWSPVVGLVFLNLDARTRALAERIIIVSSSKVATADYVVNMLARIG